MQQTILAVTTGILYQNNAIHTFLKSFQLLIALAKVELASSLASRPNSLPAPVVGIESIL